MPIVALPTSDFLIYSQFEFPFRSERVKIKLQKGENETKLVFNERFR